MTEAKTLSLDSFLLRRRHKVDLAKLEDTAGLPPNFKATKAFG